MILISPSSEALAICSSSQRASFAWVATIAWFVMVRCRRADTAVRARAPRSCWPAQPRNDIDCHGDRGDQAARRSQRSKCRDNSEGNGGHINHGDYCCHCGPFRGRGGFTDAGRPCGTAGHCQPPWARWSAAAGLPVGRRRPPLARRIARQCLPLVCHLLPARVEAALRWCGQSQTIARASAAMQPVQPSALHVVKFTKPFYFVAIFFKNCCLCDCWTHENLSKFN